MHAGINIVCTFNFIKTDSVESVNKGICKPLKQIYQHKECLHPSL